MAIEGTGVQEPVAGIEEAAADEVVEGTGETLETGDAEVEGEGSESDSADEVTVTIGDEAATETEEEQRAPTWVRELRKSNREKDRRIRELEQAVQTAKPAAQAAAEVGTRPTLQSCEYDEERLDRELTAYHERKRVADEQDAKKRTDAESAQRAWNARLENHGKLKGELKVADFDDAEAAVEAATTVTQRGLIVHGAENSALVFYALGKNPKKLKELASIDDPVKFAFAVAKLETQLKVTPRKTAPLPETIPRGKSGAVADLTLERLRAEADRTGDRTKVAAHMRKVAGAGRK